MSSKCVTAVTKWLVTAVTIFVLPPCFFIPFLNKVVYSNSSIHYDFFYKHLLTSALVFYVTLSKRLHQSILKFFKVLIVNVFEKITVSLCSYNSF